MDDLKHLSDEQLVARIEGALGSEQQLLARLVHYLGEVEDRRIHLRAAYASMFEFCTQKLGLSEGEAFRRLTAARLARRFPAILSLIEDGSMHLSALVLLRDHLTEENHAELLREAWGKSKRDLQVLLAARLPKPDVASTLRKLPERSRRLELHARPVSETNVQRGEVKAAPEAVRRPPEPLSPERYKVQFTADQALRDKLERALDLVSHANPARDLSVIVDRALDLLLAELEKKRLGKTEHPRRSRESSPGAIPRAVRREVFTRDGERCRSWARMAGAARRGHSFSSTTRKRAHSEAPARVTTSECFARPTIGCGPRRPSVGNTWKQGSTSGAIHVKQSPRLRLTGTKTRPTPSC